MYSIEAWPLFMLKKKVMEKTRERERRTTTDEVIFLRLFDTRICLDIENLLQNYNTSLTLIVENFDFLLFKISSTSPGK